MQLLIHFTILLCISILVELFICDALIIKYAIENATRTRIVMADTKIHILGSFANIKVARNAICALVLGSPPGKVYNNMRNVASRMKERF